MSVHGKSLTVLTDAQAVGQLVAQALRTADRTPLAAIGDRVLAMLKRRGWRQARRRTRFVAGSSLRVWR